MEWLAFKTWLLGTVPGVVLLGAIGSVLGGIAVVLMKICWSALAHKRLMLLQRMLFPIRIDIYQNEKLVELMGPKTSDGKYVGYLVVHCLFAALEALAFFLSFGFVLYIYLEYELDRPRVLAFFIGATLFFAYTLFKNMVCMWSLVSNDISDLAEKIEEESPKNIHEWRRFKLEMEAAAEDAKHQAAKEQAS
ncbi:hypothetical protein IB239_05760 [Pseudomonas sp. PDM12]|uniref:hypothetical protein n=1 Tax=Pseudomonas sp. PDM12 TaxID=2769260 RepID=UPI001780191C|nr:hypothetical protein [Pseudomonas sp. PDM12]MBD9654323.1 hypothetical protein [Pseudomonas sp. PDM12]